ncbi:MAG TPA: flagellar assembly protein FliW [Streptomyces sp.]|nr:flagellar assembly protein FliW [Streptomyces sp.]
MTAATAVTLPTPAAVQVLSLADPLPGFPGLRDFALVAADAGGLVFWLQSVAPDGPRFLTVPAAPYFPEYAPALPRAACAELGIDDATSADVYLLITVPDGDVSEATANLRAPLVINPATNRARQIVLTDGGLPIRQPLRR